MTVVINAIIQALGLIVLYGNQASQFVPEKYRGIVTGIVGVAMGVTAIIGHFYNPNGTSARVPYDADIESRRAS